MRDLPQDVQLILAGVVFGILWLAGSRRPAAQRVRGWAGNRPKQRFWSWWPIAVVAVCLMWAFDVFDDGFAVVSDAVDTPAATEGER